MWNIVHNEDISNLVGVEEDKKNISLKDDMKDVAGEDFYRRYSCRLRINAAVNKYKYTVAGMRIYNIVLRLLILGMHLRRIYKGYSVEKVHVDNVDGDEDVKGVDGNKYTEDFTW